MKVKVPLIDVWLVTGRRLRAGYAHRYEQGYLEGFAASDRENWSTFNGPHPRKEPPNHQRRMSDSATPLTP